MVKRILARHGNLLNGSFAGVYIASNPGSPSDMYKIGQSTNIGVRVSSQGRHMTLAISIPYSNPLALEQALHCHFGNQHVKGEWYWLYPEDLEWLKSFEVDRFMAAGNFTPLPLEEFFAKRKAAIDARLTPTKDKPE